MDDALFNQCKLTDFAENVSKLRVLLAELYEGTSYGVHNEVLKFCFRLDEKYAESKQFMLFLLIIGGTLPESTKFYDFEGEDSVESFIRRLHTHYCIEGVA